MSPRWEDRPSCGAGNIFSSDPIVRSVVIIWTQNLSSRRLKFSVSDASLSSDGNGSRAGGRAP